MNKEKDLTAMQDTVSKNLPQLKVSALAAALGSTIVLKMVGSDTGKMKYTPCTSTDEIILALEWIATYGNDLSDKQD